MNFDRYLIGNSSGKIAAGLDKQGAFSPTGNSKWNHDAISKLLSNEKYTGPVLLQKMMRFIRAQHQNGEELDQVLLKHHHKAIISTANFMKVQQMIIGRSNFHSQGYGIKMSY